MEKKMSSLYSPEQLLILFSVYETYIIVLNVSPIAGSLEARTCTYLGLPQRSGRDGQAFNVM